MCTGAGRLAGLRLALVGLLWFVGMTTGCAMRTMRAQVETLDRAVTVLQGRIGSEGWGGGPIVVVLSREAPAGGLYEIDMRLHYRPGAFLFVMREGAFQLAAFEDRNGDLVYQPGEPALAHGDEFFADEAKRLPDDGAVEIAARALAHLRFPQHHEVDPELLAQLRDRLGVSR